MNHSSETNPFASDPDEQIVVDRIYAAVMEQRLAPRTKLSESNLCESFGIGRMRVRRALLLLASQGIVELHSNRGAFVACPDPKEARDVFESRLLIEPSLIRKIANGIDTTDLKHLQEHIALEDAARASRHRSEIIRLSGEFHVKLASVSGNAVLTRVMRELVTRSSLIVGLFGGSVSSSCPDEEHAGILKAIEEGNSDRAEQLVSRHLMHIQDGLDLSVTKSTSLDLKQILGVT